VFNRYVPIAAAVAVTVAAPALATAAVAQAPRPAAASGQAVTRAAVIKGRDDAFKKIDTNNDGSMSAAELAAADAGNARRQLDAKFTQLDTNKDGQLSKAEFLAATPQPAALMPGISKTIATLDKNKDGKVTPDEFRAPQMAMFDRIDANKDGVLSDAERQAARRPKK
jgi:Ca2+-binding EF-hand superfamily protein